MNIKERYKIIKEIFNGYSETIEELIENHRFPKSMMCLYSKVRQIELLKESLDKIENNFYVSQVLLRTLLEHYLVGYYIYFKTTLEKDDIVGEDYYEYYFKSEIIKRENYYFKLDRIKGTQKFQDIQGYLIKYEELFKNITLPEINHIHQKASQFNNIPNIIKYFFEKENISNEEKAMHGMLFDFLEKYNKLSSYVHGGVAAESEAFIKNAEFDRQEKILENREWGMSLEAPIKFYFLFLLNIDNPEGILKLQDFLVI